MNLPGKNPRRPAGEKTERREQKKRLLPLRRRLNAGAESVRSGSKDELRRGSILEIKRIGGDANSLFCMDNKNAADCGGSRFPLQKRGTLIKPTRTEKTRCARESQVFYCWRRDWAVAGKVWTAKPAIAVLGGFWNRKMIQDVNFIVNWRVLSTIGKKMEKKEL